MSEHTLKKWSPLFWVAAFYNLSAAIGACAYEYHQGQFFNLTAPSTDPIAIFYHMGFWLCVAVFGLGYGMVAQHPERYPGIVILAIIGKLSVFCVFSWSYINGLGSLMMLLGGIGDFAFSLAFIAFLKDHKAQIK